jgi:hypothetical protein
MAEDAVMLELNQTMNVIDPPKDLDIGDAAPTLKTEPYKSIIKDAIQNLFGKLPDHYKVVGDDKERIIKSVQNRYAIYFEHKKNQLDVVRPKHSSGHDARPDGLYFLQDNGSTDIVSNAKLIITPGSVLDPAGKTKEVEIDFIKQGKYLTLPLDYVKRLSMEKAVNGDITFTKDYSVAIPTPMGPLKSTFDPKTFLPQGEGGKYFAGNETKNAAIADLVTASGKAAIQEIQKYILAKELGDTLQVQWLNYIFDKDTIVKRENTVVGTTDTVVCYRSIVNKVGVIWTNKGKTTYFLPFFTDAGAQVAINKSFVETIRKEVISHNLSILTLLQRVRDRPLDNLSKGVGEWVNGQTWSVAQHKNATDYLTALITGLTNINNDLDIYFNALADPEAAKNLASRSHFISPFTWFASQGYFKTNNKVTYLIPGDRIRFPAKSFTPTTFIAAPKDVLFQKGGYRQGGGVRSLAKKTSAAKKTIDFQSLIDTSIHEMYEPHHEYTIPAAIRDKVNRDMSVEVDEYKTYILSANEIHTNFFLYCYIRDYHPEIFTYAYIIKDVIQKRKAGFFELFCGCGRGSSEYKLVTFDLATTYDAEYYVNEKDRFILTASPVGDQDKAYSATRQAIRLAMAFTDAFPSLLTPQLAGFFKHLKAHYSRQFPMIRELVGHEVNTIHMNQSGGGAITKAEYDELLDEAMDNYEVYFSLQIKGAYKNHDLTENEYISELIKRSDIIPTIYKTTQKTRKMSVKEKYALNLLSKRKQALLKKATQRRQKKRNSLFKRIRTMGIPKTPPPLTMMVYGGKRKTRRLRNKN